MYIQRNSEALFVNHRGCSEKAISLTYSESGCSFSYPACKTHAPYHIVIVTCPAVPYFSTLSLKCHDFRKRVLEHKICFGFPDKSCLKYF